MTWRPEPAAATWLQAALFGCPALGFGPTSLAGYVRVRRPSPPALLHALVAAPWSGCSPRCPPWQAWRRPGQPAARWRRFQDRHARPGDWLW